MLQDWAVTVQAASHAARHNKSFISYLFWDLNCMLTLHFYNIWITLPFMCLYSSFVILLYWDMLQFFILFDFLIYFASNGNITEAPGWLSINFPLMKRKRSFCSYTAHHACLLITLLLLHRNIWKNVDFYLLLLLSSARNKDDENLRKLVSPPDGDVRLDTRLKQHLHTKIVPF